MTPPVCQTCSTPISGIAFRHTVDKTYMCRNCYVPEEDANKIYRKTFVKPQNAKVEDVYSLRGNGYVKIPAQIVRNITKLTKNPKFLVSQAEDESAIYIIYEKTGTEKPVSELPDSETV